MEYSVSARVYKTDTPENKVLGDTTCKDQACEKWACNPMCEAKMLRHISSLIWTHSFIYEEATLARN
ncbi:hypothetical protein AciPR4_1525 [Terriglobus saanensis SP1PR4]|uniref:Uncharacterized protein n=1 Tax=Terriglobus saanensis (strain ATCC BAA-1853 / DSM 23119 / SP1PR4) TaxID=401053 RepID=E8V1R6_TERSS|nr:hypothetical protein AciPR4_1525 [Terriglobus saanensis SP1PR4]